MGGRNSKRLDISGTPKKGELENGAVTATEEKLEKIAEADASTTKVNANGSTTTTSTVTAEQQETTTTAATTEAGEAPSTKSEIAEEQTEKAADVTIEEKSVTEPNSPASPNDTAEEGSKKKKKPKTKWSFRSFSFSKKDKVKPSVSKEEKQETVPEDNENTQNVEQVNTEAVNVAAVQNEEPPPLPTSPPPTPADETAEKEETPTISEGDVDASGGGEGLAEPIEGELEESTTVAATEVTTPVVEPPLTNGVSQNGDYKEQNGKFNEDDELISPVHERKPSVDSVTAKIGSLKLQIASENAEQPAQNGVEETAPVELNGVKENDVAATEKAVEN